MTNSANENSGGTAKKTTASKNTAKGPAENTAAAVVPPPKFKPEDHLKAVCKMFNVKTDGEREVFVFSLEPRHAHWLAKVARKEQRTIPNMIDRLIRLEYANDPYQGNEPPKAEPGQSIGSVLAKDMG